MKFIRIILFPITPIYFIVTWLRNWLYDVNVFESRTYETPLICVGNLSTGGTGKTPLIEYLIRLLQNNNRVATLSRGYKRNTDGFVLANKDATVQTIGDEPYQFYKKFDNIHVAVDSNRQNGIEQLLKLKDQTNVILLDDAYQHRKVSAGLNILLTAYDKPYYLDFVLPTGNLREPKSGRKRADIILVTKCKSNITEADKAVIKQNLKLKSHQKVFFSFITYAQEVIGFNSNLNVADLPKFTLVTGIANADPLVDYLVQKGLKFDHIEYPDHHNFRVSEIEMLSKKELLITTEKDFVRLSANKRLSHNLYYLPIETKIENEEEFNALIKAFVFKRSLI
ncbi:tetraacyldisaccharide 4'-kinase [Winogradskyella alexanderae]|uniref:Tetraacyldisaccharide 4'-kinase n=1 Tax=Winogradskyella alexanderae TaxID=2877123 RepID=A0ABS7XSM6_9FLAO|nr:tetraacyldisaccharide 4'-kinase [Winogradskyella alexanderae]MCA0133015.1 tetraacyldisaccharide 4'-kinase [Winogradskyella alexanderae]